MAYLQVPIRSDLPSYNLQIVFEGTPYNLTFRWNERGGYWTMDIATGDDVPIVMGIKLVAGYPITDQWQDPLLPPGEFLLIDSDAANANPSVFDFGSRFKLIYRESTTPEGE